MSLISCAGKRPSNLGVIDKQFTTCPATPNCVSSDSKKKSHHIPAYTLNTSHSQHWLNTKELLITLPRTTIVTETDNYLHAECASALLGFVDDFELHYRVDDNIIAVRSASRLGSSDFGVNRKRVETVRKLLISNGIVLE